MEKFFRWLWEPIDLLSQALKWIYEHPKHVFFGALVVAIVALEGFPARCCVHRGIAVPRDAAGGESPEAEWEKPALRRMPPPPVPKDYTDNPGAAMHDLEALTP